MERQQACEDIYITSAEEDPTFATDIFATERFIITKENWQSDRVEKVQNSSAEFPPRQQPHILRTGSGGSISEIQAEFSGTSQIDEDFLDFSDSILLGAGGTGSVLKAKYHGVDVAVKVLSASMEKIGEHIRMEPSHRQKVKDMAQEFRASRMLPNEHPNLPKLVGACLSDVHNIKLVYDLILGQNLEQIVRNMGKPKVLTALNWSVQLFCGLSYLHSATDGKTPMIHRDVKPSNIMVSEDLSCIKLVDFGLCTWMHKEQRENRKMSGKTGSFRYMAPEVMQDKGEYTDKVDVYSASIVVWYAFLGVTPLVALQGEVVAELAARQQLRPPLREIIAISPDLASILEQGWHQDEDVRLDSATMLRMLQDLETNMLVAQKVKRGASIYNKLTTKLRGVSEQFLAQRGRPWARRFSV